LDQRTRMVVQGVSLGLSLVVFFMLLFAMFFIPTETEVDRAERFKIVDSYNNCDVVRYTDPWGSKYHYFLHCK